MPANTTGRKKGPHHAKVHVPVPRRGSRPSQLFAGPDARAHEEVGDLVQDARRERPARRRRSLRNQRQGAERLEKDAERRSVRRGEGRGRWLRDREREERQRRGRNRPRLSRLRVRRRARSATAARHDDVMASAYELCDHLFRHQSARMVAVLVRILGPANVELAEDVVQDVLCRALETWKYGRLPESPEAWLMQAAKHRAIDIVRRRGRFDDLSAELARQVESEGALAPDIEASFEEAAIQDGLLRLAFSCCDPSLGVESQVAMILKYLCGFSVREIARAFLTSEDTVEKRLSRARSALKVSRAFDELAPEELARERLPTVLHALYLLFNEGYHGANDEVSVREELCLEALRLASMLAAHAAFATPNTKALVALMCLHGARLPARLDEEKGLVTLAGQDRSRWNHELLGEGLCWLAESASGERAGEYHLEAAIAGQHAVAASVEATDWAMIRELYDALYRIKPSAVVALNRAIAIGLAEGPEAGVAALETLPGRERLESYPFYAAALGDMHLRAGSADVAREHFTKASRLARNAEERRFLERRLSEISERSAS